MSRWGYQKVNQRGFPIFMVMAFLRPAKAGPWRRAPLVFAATVAVLGVASCDIFETRVFTPVEDAAISLNLLPDSSSDLVFRYAEYLQTSGRGNVRDTLIGEGTLRITRLGADSLTGGSRYQRVVLGDGTVSQRRDTLALAQGDEGFVMLAGSVFGGGFLPPGSSGDTASTAEASSVFKLLPPNLETGNRWRLVQGDKICERQLVGRDTLDADGRLQEAWRVSESFSLQSKPLSQADYWFAESGLLQAEWRWGAVALTSDQAEDLGSMAFRRVLWRVF